MLEYRFFEYYQNHRCKTRTEEKARVFDLLSEKPEISRKQLQSILKCRPNNITEYVQEFIDDGLVVEGKPMKSAKGRPELSLKINSKKHVALALWVDGRTCRGAFVNLSGNVSQLTSVPVPQDIDNTGFYEILVRFISDFKLHLARGQELIGIGIALPGPVMSDNYRWTYNSHLTNIRNMDFSRLLHTFSVPVRLYGLVDSQLLAVVNRNHLLKNSNVLLVRWGEGIGASLYLNGSLLRSISGVSCEIGHIKVVSGEKAIKCRCGEVGCLETVAARWSLLPKLGMDVPVTGEDETRLISELKAGDFKGNEAMEAAIDGLVFALDCVFRICFPDRIILHGPFFQNPGIRNEFKERLSSILPSYSSPDTCIDIVDSAFNDETAVGCTYELIFDFLLKRMEFRG